MEGKEIISKIKRHIAKGETDEAIELLINHSEEIGCKSNDEAILLSGQYSQWKREKMLGIHQTSSELHRIEMAIMEIIDSRLGKQIPALKKEIIQPIPVQAQSKPIPVKEYQVNEKTKEPEKRNLVPILATVTGLLIIVLIFILLNNREEDAVANNSVEQPNALIEEKTTLNATNPTVDLQENAIDSPLIQPSASSKKEVNPLVLKDTLATPPKGEILMKKNAADSPSEPTANTSTSAKPAVTTPSPEPKSTTKRKKSPYKSLTKGQTLYEGEQLISSNGKYQLILQKDGNLIIYENDFKPVWASRTSGSGAGGKLVLQSSGNLVLYNKNSKSIWSSNTDGATKLTLGNDGRLGLYDTNGNSIWLSERLQ